LTAQKRKRYNAAELAVTHNIDPYDYFVDVLQRVKDHPPLQMDELTPRRWKELFASNPLRATLHLIDQNRNAS